MRCEIKIKKKISCLSPPLEPKPWTTDISTRTFRHRCRSVRILRSSDPLCWCRYVLVPKCPGAEVSNLSLQVPLCDLVNFPWKWLASMPPFNQPRPSSDVFFEYCLMIDVHFDWLITTLSHAKAPMHYISLYASFQHLSWRVLAGLPSPACGL